VSSIYRGRRPRFGSAVSDIVEGFRQNWLWSGWRIKICAAVSRLGARPSLADPDDRIMIGTMGSSTPNCSIPSSKITCRCCGRADSLQFSAGMITEGCGTFDSVRGIIQQVKLPFSLHAYRLVYRNILVLVHSLVIVPIVLIIFPHPIEWLRLLELGPDLCSSLSTGGGQRSARHDLRAFRDVPPIVANIVQVVFFLTPIMWPRSARDNIDADIAG